MLPGAAANMIVGFAPSQIQLLLAALEDRGAGQAGGGPDDRGPQRGRGGHAGRGQVPVISAAAGINGPGVTYRPVGTELRFLPVVYGNGKIHLTVAPRVTAVNNAQALVTTFGRRRPSKNSG